MKRYAALLLFLCLPMSFSALAAAAETLSGVVLYDGTPPENRMVRMNADPKCAALHDSDRVVGRDTIIAEDGGVLNVFVYLRKAPAGEGPFEAPSQPKRLVQSGCFYAPKVLGIMVRQNLEVVNEDPTLHNVRCLARSNRPFNLGQPAEGTRTKFFTKPEEAIGFKCDVHPWMSSTIFVLDHPFYATTDKNGRFEIDGLPKGPHSLVVWHKTLGERVVEVQVPRPEPLEIRFEPPTETE